MSLAVEADTENAFLEGRLGTRIFESTHGRLTPYHRSTGKSPSYRRSRDFCDCPGLEFKRLSPDSTLGIGFDSLESYYYFS